MDAHEVAHYQQMARDHRGTSRQVGAFSDRSQAVRFEVILDVLDSMLGDRLTGLSLLDLGCGKADLAVHLDRAGRLPGLRYTGIDGVQDNVDDGRAHGRYDVRFGRWDGRSPLAGVDGESFDLIVFSGTLATARRERRATMYRALLAQARVGVVGNFVTAVAGVDDYAGTIPMDPDEALRWVDRAEFRVQLRADYLAHDFTVGTVRWSF